MSDRNNYRKKSNEIRSSLDDILNDDSITASIDSTSLPPIRSTPILPAFNYIQKKDAASEKAKKTIGSLLKFYLSEEIINNDEYVKAKMKIEEMTLGSLFFQMETAERAITILLQQIDDGDVSPRMFEVLGTLQKSMLDIIKSQTMYMIATEEGVKKLSRDYDVYSQRKLVKSEDTKKTQSSGNVNRGTKNLMMQIQDEIKKDEDPALSDPEQLEPEIDDFPSIEEDYDE
jgi:hypothetical protein